MWKLVKIVIGLTVGIKAYNTFAWRHTDLLPHYPHTVELTKLKPDSGYRLSNLFLNSPAKDSTFMVLTLSGGGTRAAALSYGVIDELDHWKRVSSSRDSTSLADEVDLVSSISGGTIAAGYWAAFGKKTFLTTFEKRFLNLKFQSKYANPIGLT